jgi:5-(carboxyamino)imidazole ribonucleotide synthase
MTQASDHQPIPPGATIGILGSGQLGRMLAIAAAQLGFRCHIYADTAGPAFDVAAAHTVAAYDDQTALAAFTKIIDVATFEFENIPAKTVEFLTTLVPVRPGAKALACAQDRLNEKRLARDVGALTADFASIDSLERLQAQLNGPMALPCVLKTRRDGYDGKGQAKIFKAADAKTAWDTINARPAILESFVPFQSEVSVIAARGLKGEFRAFDITENEHRNHILHRSVAPARIDPVAAAAAINTARQMAERLDYVGVFAIEFFVLNRAGEQVLLVNEMAPRVHNSGHWTIEGAATSQFEQHIRAVAGWPLGATTRRAPSVEMINLIGDDIHTWRALAAEPGTAIHHYGKRDARPGRKMGHVTRLLS